jgi:hypothetical protein
MQLAGTTLMAATLTVKASAPAAKTRELAVPVDPRPCRKLLARRKLLLQKRLARRLLCDPLANRLILRPNG